MKIRMPQHTLGLAFQRAARGHCVQNELHKETRKKRNQTTRVFDFYNAVLVHKRCWHSVDFGLFFHFLMLSMQFLLVASHFHVPLVLDLRVWFFCCCPAFPCVLFCDDKIAHICGAVASIPGGLVSSCAAMHAAFQSLLHPSALVS